LPAELADLFAIQAHFEWVRWRAQCAAHQRDDGILTGLCGSNWLADDVVLLVGVCAARQLGVAALKCAASGRAAVQLALADDSARATGARRSLEHGAVPRREPLVRAGCVSGERLGVRATHALLGVSAALGTDAPPRLFEELHWDEHGRLVAIVRAFEPPLLDLEVVGALCARAARREAVLALCSARFQLLADGAARGCLGPLLRALPTARGRRARGLRAELAIRRNGGDAARRRWR
jgi:hypothetical protein